MPFPLPLALVASALGAFQASPVRARLEAEPAVLEAGGATSVRVVLEVEKDWHIYPHDFEGLGNKTVLEAELPEGFEIVGWRWPAPHEIDLFGERTPVHDGTVTVEGDLRAAAHVPLGRHGIAVGVRYQACSNVCVDGAARAEATVEIVEAGKAPKRADRRPAPLDSGGARPAAEERLPGVPVSPPRPYPMAVSMELSKAALAPGEDATLSIHLTIEPGYHTYAPASPRETVPLSIEAEGFELRGALEGPPPRRHEDPLLKLTRLEYEGSVTLTQRVRLSAAGGKEPPKVTLTGLVCDASTCLAPNEWVARFDVRVLPGPARDVGHALDDSAITTGSLGSLPLGGFLLASVLGGWASLFTPCVFPMIPITVSFFAKRSGGRRGRAIGLAAAYAFGIIGTFTLIGVLVSVLFGASGLASFATNLWVNLALGSLFVVFGLSLLGLFHFAAPAGLTNRIEEAKGESRNDWILTFLMATAFTLASFTCTVPILGALLGLSAKGSVALPTIGMLAYSATFAAPFFLLALFPTALQKLPRGGAWLEVVKISMGFVELAAALKFLSAADIAADTQILTRPLYLAATVAIFLALTLYLFGILRMPGAEDEVGPVRAVFAIGTLSISLYLFAGLFGLQYGSFVESFLPKPEYGGAAVAAAPRGSADERALVWIEDLDQGLAEAKRTNKRIFLNFTGDLCVNCRGMEQGMFPRPAVSAELRKLVLVELVLDRESTPALAARSARYRAYQESAFDTAARPFYVVLEPDGTTVVSTFAGSTNDEARFVRFLRGEKVAVK